MIESDGLMKNSRLRFLCVLGVLALSGCAGVSMPHPFGGGGQGPQTVGNYKVGNPYRVGSVWYYPQESFTYTETGIASWYGPDFHGGKTANGEIYDQNELTAAHRTLQMPSFVRVTNLENGRSVVVRVNDRGPYLHGRIIDVSKRAAELLGFIGHGTARVRLDVLDKESRQIADAAKRGVNVSHMTVADMGNMPSSAPAVEAAPAPVQVAQNNPEALPESLQTPTITVEELSAPGKPVATIPPSWKTPPSDKGTTPFPPAAYAPPLQPSHVGMEPISGHLNKGRFMPDPVVTTEPVHVTGIFVQAGAFGVQANAQKLKDKLSKIAPASIETVTVGGKTMYRVKLGPLNSVAAADRVLDQVIRAGQNGARVIKK